MKTSKLLTRAYRAVFGSPYYVKAIGEFTPRAKWYYATSLQDANEWAAKIHRTDSAKICDRTGHVVAVRMPY